VWKLGVHPPSRTAFAQTGRDVLFAAILANWVALAGCATAAAAATQRLQPGNGEASALFGGALCFFGFFCQPAVLTGLTEGVSWLLVALAFVGFLARSLLLVGAILVLSILQRETIPIALGAFSLATWVVTRRNTRFLLAVVALSCAAFVLYLLMRTLWWPVAGHEDQLSLAAFLQRLADWRRLANTEFLRQTLLSQNLLIIVGVVWAARLAANSPAFSELVGGVVALFGAAVTLLVLGVGILDQVNNVGRLVAILTPIAAPLLVASLTDRSPRKWASLGIAGRVPTCRGLLPLAAVRGP
jgi:hypothetical protein